MLGEWQRKFHDPKTGEVEIVSITELTKFRPPQKKTFQNFCQPNFFFNCLELHYERAIQHSYKEDLTKDFVSVYMSQLKLKRDTGYY